MDIIKVFGSNVRKYRSTTCFNSSLNSAYVTSNHYGYETGTDLFRTYNWVLPWRPWEK